MSRMKELIEYIKYRLTPNPFSCDKQIIEMASISQPVLNRTKYNIVLHGADSGDRETPNIHIYLYGDVRPFSKFNFEISLTDIVCYDELNLVKQDDGNRHIRRNNRSKCSWDGYTKLKHDFEDWLFFVKPLNPNFKNHLHAIIWTYNNESTSKGTNALKTYCKEKGLKILDKYMDLVEDSYI